MVSTTGITVGLYVARLNRPEDGIQQIGKEMFDQPTSVACTDEAFFVLESRGTIQVFDRVTHAHTQTIRTSAQNGVSLLLHAGLLYVSDIDSHCIFVWTTQGTWVRTIGQGTRGSASFQFDRPQGLCVSGAHLYVADQRNDRVQVWTLEGIFVGTLGTGFGGCGPGELNGPYSVAVRQGRVYVKDYSKRVAVFQVL
jgi:DNA-binding beta-propeller fold protein YncE